VKIGLAQLDTRVGAVEANTDKILEAAGRARDTLHCDLVLLPELAISGYPPEDLLLHKGLRRRIAAGMARLCSEIRDIAFYVGYPEYADDHVYNSGALVHNGQILANHRKQILPNYAVFDEKRYFEAGGGPTVVELSGVRFGLIICEDIWFAEPAKAAVDAGAETLLVINGSPFDIGQQLRREQMVADRALECGVPVVYLNMVGGQDELVFDGGSFAVDHRGEIVHRAVSFEESLSTLELEPAQGGVHIDSDELRERRDMNTDVYDALVLGTRDYVEKNRFPGVILGLSGGIDSALTLAVAVDALGADRVHAIMMPSRYTSEMSLEDSQEQARALGVRFEVLSIEPMVEATLEQLAPVFAGLERDATEENIQARCRGILLMAISNKLGEMLLTTGNKSEMAVGYATLYGDMAGGFAPLKDCSKTLVYSLARYRNTKSPVIPARVITREPSAELAPGQKDSDSLPPYDVLDPILAAFIERDLSVEDIVELGFDKKTVVRVLNLVKRAEYKRRQAPPGVRVSSRAFGRDWRYPITSGY
jgi:NAD+ synthase (glutamine-hydrolysing)